MNFLYLLPVSYFYRTRLAGGSWAFHALFEWMAAAMLVLALGRLPAVESLGHAVLTYLAFVSIYEIGYLANDLFAAAKEEGGRKRGPQGAGAGWILSWVAMRIAVFLGVTLLLGQQFAVGWWSFFSALTLVFALHNVLVDREFKAATFLWLAWFRFMAPVIFIVEDRFRMGIGLAAAIAYASFRMFGYLDGKSLLRMPGRKRITFRVVFFVMPLAGVVALFPYPEARGFVLLAGYYALVALVGAVASKFRLLSHR